MLQIKRYLINNDGLNLERHLILCRARGTHQASPHGAAGVCSPVHGHSYTSNPQILIYVCAGGWKRAEGEEVVLSVSFCILPELICFSLIWSGSGDGCNFSLFCLQQWSFPDVDNGQLFVLWELLRCLNQHNCGICG